MTMEGNQAATDDLDDDALEALQTGAIDHEGTGDDEDLETYGKRVQKRIGKEVSKRKVVETERDQFKSEAQRYREELERARKRLSEYEEQDDKNLEDREKDLIARRAKALDEGEMKEYNELNDELMDLKVERRTRKVIKPEPEPVPAKEDTTSRVSEATRKWVDQNSDWLNSDKAKAAEAVKIERQLIKEGYSTSDPDLYQELDKRLNGGTDDDESIEDLLEEDERPQQRGATTGVPRDRGTRQAGKRGRLTRDDLVRMKRANLDPNNPEHRKAWIKRNDPL
jgi:hypothetical protein